MVFVDILEWLLPEGEGARKLELGRFGGGRPGGGLVGRPGCGDIGVRVGWETPGGRDVHEVAPGGGG